VTEAPAAQRLSTWALWFGGLAFFTCYLGQTVLGVTQPTLTADLGLSASESQWVVNSFFLTLALFAAPGGRLGDYYGHRQVLLVALAIFALGSLSAAVSQGFLWLVVSNGVAGIGASTLYPASAAMIANRVPVEHRGDALGKYSAIGVTVFVIGPVMAGLLTEAIEWRAIFAFDALLAVALVAVGLLRVDNRPVGEPEPFDYRGLAVLMSGLSALLVGLMQALAWGWDAPPTLLLVVAGLAALAGFAVLELRAAHPLLDVGLLRRRILTGIVVAMFGAQVVVTGFVIYGATYFQHVLGFGPLVASLALASSMFAEPLFNVLAGRVTDRVGPRRPAVFGYLFTAVALAWIAGFADHDSYALLLPGLLILNASIAPMFTSLLTGLANAVSAEERGDANALVLTVRWIGAAVGTMALGLIIHSGGAAVVTDPAPYSQAFLILAGTALAGAVACALLLRGEAPR